MSSTSDETPPGLELGALVDEVGDEELVVQRVQFAAVQFSKFRKHMASNAGRDGPFDGYVHEYQHLALLERKDKRPLVKITKPIMFKNRYLDIIPVEATNVTLGLGAAGAGKVLSMAEAEALEADAYINANYVSLWTDMTYVAAQGPLPNTVVDFWRMVWQQDASMVVMLTNLIERGIEKCTRYWPSAAERAAEPATGDNEAALYAADVGPFVIELLSSDASPDYVLRRLRMVHVESGTVKAVIQAHYTAWPDQGTPDPAPFARFCNVINARLPALKPAPLIVHCSAGVGRTGVFMACHDVLQHMRAYLLTGVSKMPFLFDVKATVRRMRQHRPFMVQNSDQYRFVYDYVASQVHSFFSSPAVLPIVSAIPEQQEDDSSASASVDSLPSADADADADADDDDSSAIMLTLPADDDR